MESATLVILSSALSFGSPILFLGWDLWRMKPTNRRLPPDDGPVPEPSPILPDTDTMPRVQKPLPDCLIPKPLPRRVPELV